MDHETYNRIMNRGITLIIVLWLASLLAIYLTMLNDRQSLKPQYNGASISAPINTVEKADCLILVKLEDGSPDYHAATCP